MNPTDQNKDEIKVGGNEMNANNQPQPMPQPSELQQNNRNIDTKTVITDSVHSMYGLNIIVVLAVTPTAIILNTFTDWRSSVAGIVIGFLIMAAVVVVTLVVVLKLFPEKN